MTLGARRLVAVVLLSALAVVGVVTDKHLDMMDAEEAAGLESDGLQIRGHLHRAPAEGMSAAESSTSILAAPSAPKNSSGVDNDRTQRFVNVAAPTMTTDERIFPHATVTPGELCVTLLQRRWLRLAVAQQADGGKWQLTCAY